MAPISLTFNPDQSRTLDAPVRRIDVTTGSVLVTAVEETERVGAGESYEAADTANLTLYSPDSARVAVTYSDERAEIPPREVLEVELAAAEKIRDRIATEVSGSDAEVAARESVLQTAESRVSQAKRRLFAFYPDAPLEKAPRRKKSRKGSKVKS